MIDNRDNGTLRKLSDDEAHKIGRASSGRDEAEVYSAATDNAVKHLQETIDLEELEVITSNDTFDQKIVLHPCLADLLKLEIEAPILISTIEAAAYFPFALLKVRLNDKILANREG